MNKTLLKDTYNIGENMAVYSGEGKSFTVINRLIASSIRKWKLSYHSCQ